ncbi:MAG: hypothetical protein Q9201_001128 [Fulgogasparrea decipioides]
MGNQISTAVSKRSGMSCDRDTPPRSSASHNDPRQESSKAALKKRKQMPKLKLPSRGQSRSYSPTSLPSTPDSDSITLRQRSTGTDGASTPKDDKFESPIRAPSPMTEVQYLSLSLRTASPSEASTITQGILNVSNPRPPSPSTVADASLLAPSRPSSPPSSEQQQPSRPLFPPSPQDLRKVPAPPLLPSHFACYQSHQRMLRSQNGWHPVPCMTCGIEDEQARWRCVWCCLRICEQCMDALNKSERRDLKALVKGLSQKVNHGPVRKDGDNAPNESKDAGVVSPRAKNSS